MVYTGWIAAVLMVGMVTGNSSSAEAMESANGTQEVLVSIQPDRGQMREQMHNKRHMDIRPLTEEFDLILTDWRRGQKLDLKHALFQLDAVKEGGVGNSMGAILFTGQSFGVEGRISITFFDMEGNQFIQPKGRTAVANVDQQRKTFSVGAIIPAELRGREGIVQIAFRGNEDERAAFQLKVKF